MFTREFAADIGSHLNEGGVFLQWMKDEFVDEALLRTLAATLASVLEYVRLYYTGTGMLMFMASDAALDEVLAASRITDAWYRDAARLRSVGRVNATEDRERLAREALQIIDRALILTDNESLHRIRTA